MPRAVPAEVAQRRRERLAELIGALGQVRGARVTQREFSASIGREQGTIAAILGGHRALGSDVLAAVVRAYELPVSAFDDPESPDFLRYLGATGAMGSPRLGVPSPAARTVPLAPPAVGSTVLDAVSRRRPTQAASEGARVAHGHATTGLTLADVLEALRPERSVAMALEWLAFRGARHGSDEWACLVIAAQSALDRQRLTDWLEEALVALGTDDAEAAESMTVQPPRLGPRTVVVHAGTAKSSRLSRV